MAHLTAMQHERDILANLQALRKRDPSLVYDKSTNAISASNLRHIVAMLSEAEKTVYYTLPPAHRLDFLKALASTQNAVDVVINQELQQVYSPLISALV